ncbi:MAG: PHP domain-containing protein [Acidaminococcaceae bacterium]|jgi:predicted metal-dependent phosphoesterase TrpH|nr:PHP domain-containing protein [Acidaminococcaceae bacterium]
MADNEETDQEHGETGLTGLADLHMHSTYSDGIYTPEELASAAAAAGIRVLSVTDHDTLKSIPYAAGAAAACGLRYIPGVELSARQGGRQVHILGYGIRPDCAFLAKRLVEVRNARLIRLQEILDKLHKLGIDLAVPPPKDGERAVGRPHVARAMVAAGYVSDVEEAFARYIGEGRPAYVPQPKMTPAEGVELIHEAGGIAVQAHPEEVGSPELVLELLDELPYDGIEVYHPSASPERQAFWKGEAEKRHFLITGGSDLHGTTGRFPERLGQWKVPLQNITAFLACFGIL